MKKLYLLAGFLLVIANIHAQHFISFKISDHKEITGLNFSESDKTYTVQFSDDSLSKIFNRYKIQIFEKAYPTYQLGKHPHASRLDKVYHLEADNIDRLYREIVELKATFISDVKFSRKAIPLSTPDDYSIINCLMFGNTVNSGSQLDLIRAQESWDITQGSENIVIGIIDFDFDTSHEDISGKVLSTIMSGFVGYHGTQVAGMAGANTNNNKGIASIGNKSMLRFYLPGNDLQGVLAAAYNGVKVINCSFISTCTFDQDQQDIIDIVTSPPYNVIVVSAAGNGLTGNHCGGASNGNGLSYPASYNNVISVTSVGHHFDPPILTNGKKFNWKDHHDWSVGEPAYSHTHNASVDICATGYNVSVLKPGNSYGCYDGWGTSFSSPTVAGAAALILAVNPNLLPADVEAIIKCTARDLYEIFPNYIYLNELGAGRLDAYKAVELAQTWPQGYGGTQNLPPSNIRWFEILSDGTNTIEIETNCLSDESNSMCNIGYRLEVVANEPDQIFKWLIFYSEGGSEVFNSIKYGNSIILTRGVDYPFSFNSAGKIDVAVRTNDCIPSTYYNESRELGCIPDPCVNICDDDILITGSYYVPLTESSTWIRSSGSTTIVSTASVTLDADRIDGYVEMRPVNNEYFLASPSNNIAVFKAQALEGCNGDVPAKAILLNTTINPLAIGAKIFDVYPNPSQGFFTITANYDLSKAEIMIIDMKGNIQKIQTIGINKSSASINLPNVSKGVYILKVITRNKTEVRKIIIQ